MRFAVGIKFMTTMTPPFSSRKQAHFAFLFLVSSVEKHVNVWNLLG